MAFVAGPALNVYNPDTLALLASWGAVRWIPPVEMPRTMLAEMPIPAGHGNRSVCLRAFAAGVFVALFHRTALQFAEGFLPVPLYRPPGWLADEYP